MSEELKPLPCPFCGGPASTHTYITESLFSHDQVEHLTISCDECDFLMTSEQQDELREKWNRRSLPDAGGVVEVLERIEDHLLRERNLARNEPARREALQYAAEIVEAERQTALASLSPRAGEEGEQGLRASVAGLPSAASSGPITEAEQAGLRAAFIAGYGAHIAETDRYWRDDSYTAKDAAACWVEHVKSGDEG